MKDLLERIQLNINNLDDYVNYVVKVHTENNGAPGYLHVQHQMDELKNNFYQLQQKLENNTEPWELGGC